MEQEEVSNKWVECIRDLFHDKQKTMQQEDDNLTRHHKIKNRSCTQKEK